MVNRGLRAAAVRNVRLQGLSRRLPHRGDDSGSLMFALLLMFVATALAGLMAPVLLVAINGTRSDQTRVSALAAAQAGIDVGMAQIRAANDGSGNGVLSLLPCGQLSGSVSTANPARYQVTVQYFTSDPRGHDSTWQGANAILCVPGAGARSAPAYGLLVSYGSDTASGSFTTANSRTVQATYIFQSTNANIVGGLIHISQITGSTDLCIDAGSAAPTTGTNVTMRPCSTDSDKQSWAYNNNLTIELVSSVTSAQPLGMCLDAGTPEKSNAVVQVQPCSPTTKPQQQWSLNDSANFNGTDNGSSLNGYCFNVQNPNVSGSLIVLSGCGGSTVSGSSYDNVRQWAPEASVGAGAAGASSGQLVDFDQFGRCLDIPNYDVGAGYMIAWPCKQAPDPTNVGWNQRWVLPTVNATTGQSSASRIYTTVDDKSRSDYGTQYCLKSPGVPSAGSYVSIVTCPATLTSNYKWTVYTKTTDYTTSYRIVDGSGDGSGTGAKSTNGLCLQPADQDSTYSNDFFASGSQVMKLIVQVCDGSTIQKWNAPANILSPLPLKDIGEN